ncbi:sugar phosphate isomerase/epimerase family protein [Marinilactibacillus kalidii]|uniref:sugar phosphate isomerase/epimerase family protein n=1 Tax=Marinilactibacillus kalidii TaxID=2820274 RepID=UPI001FC9F986|nr:sugar phosphate isomerase/epimerase family protein [Marinilactibacillus kalidii]
MISSLNLGIRAHDLGPVEITTLIRKLKYYQLNHIQFAVKKSFPELIETDSQLTPGLAHYYSNQFEKAGIKISVLGCYVNIIDVDKDKRKKALKYFERYLGLAGDFKASMVATETGSIEKGYTKKNFTEAAFQEVVQSVRQLTIAAEKLGTTVAIEAGMNHPLYTAQLAKRLLKEINSPNLKLILDCVNLINLRNHKYQAEVIDEALALLGDDIVAIHLKDYRIETGKIEIVPVGTGEMSYSKIMKFIKYQKPHLFVLLESTREPELEDSLNMLNNLYVKS